MVLRRIGERQLSVVERVDAGRDPEEHATLDAKGVDAKGRSLCTSAKGSPCTCVRAGRSAKAQRANASITRTDGVHAKVE